MHGLGQGEGFYPDAGFGQFPQCFFADGRHHKAALVHVLHPAFCRQSVQSFTNRGGTCAVMLSQRFNAKFESRRPSAAQDVRPQPFVGAER